MVPPSTYKRLDVAIVGAPNAGKSQLLNVLTDTNLSAVSRKRHTTRTGTMGARTLGNTQIAFVDTPGFLQVQHAKAERLDRNLLIEAGGSTKDVDYTLLVVDAARTPTQAYLTAIQQLIQNAIRSEGRKEDQYAEVNLYPEGFEQALKEEDAIDVYERRKAERRSKVAIVMNKVDLVKPKKDLLVAAQVLATIAANCLVYERAPELYPNANSKYLLEEKFDDSLPKEIKEFVTTRLPPVYYISALEEDGTDELLRDLVRRATPCRTWRVEREKITDKPDLERIEEIIREKLYRCLHREVPHSVKQSNQIFQRNEEDNSIIIHQNLIVGTKSHQRLVYGHNGKTLERIQETAVKDLSRYVYPENRVDLRLHVKLDKKASL